MWIVTAVSIFGSILNAFKSKWCFYVWILANAFWFAYDIYIDLYSRAALDIVQTIICVSGIYYWNKRSDNNEDNS